VKADARIEEWDHDGWILRIFWFFVGGFSSPIASEVKTSRDAVGLHEKHGYCAANTTASKTRKNTWLYRLDKRRAFIEAVPVGLPRETERKSHGRS